MSAQDRAIQKLAKELAGIKREVTSWRGPQLDYSSIENSGNFTFKDSDGNVTAVVGGQDDGSNTIRHVDGPTPPIPSGLSAHVDGPIIQVSWDGTFEDGVAATYDWSHLEVFAVGPGNEQLTATINDITGASTSVAATVSGEWDVYARSVSRAEKRSLDGDAGTVDVKLVDIDGAIEAVQDSANGKNQVTYSEHAPTPADPGIFDDTWFVGQVGRPNDVVQATNMAVNPSFENGVDGWGISWSHRIDSITQTSNSWGVAVGQYAMEVTGSSTPSRSGCSVFTGPYSVNPGEWVSAAASLRRGSSYPSSVLLRLNWLDAAGETISGDNLTGFIPLTANSSNLDDLRYVGTTMQVPAGVDSFDLLIQYRSYDGTAPPPANFTAHIDAVQFTYGDSRESVDLAVSGGYFDGDTEDGATDDDPHYRWTGTPHASTSEKYLPALTIGDSDNWNIIEQYRHDGTGWVRVELSHKVFSSVDLGKATVGELDGIRITGQTIRGQQLSGDAIDGKVITGGTYRTTGGTGSWSDDGLFIAQPDGTSMVRFPTDGSPLSLTASDVQIDRASVTDLDLSYGSVRSGGQVTLASGVTAPPSPPELTTGWQKVATLDKPDPGRAYDWTGLAAWGDKWVRTVNVLGATGGDADTINIYNTDGTLDRSFTIDNNPRHGLTVMGDIVYVVGPDRVPRPGVEKNWCHGFDLNTGARVTRWEFTRLRDVKNRLALGTDGTNLVVAGVTPAPTLFVLRFDPATGVQVGSDWSTATGSWRGGQDLEGVHVSGTEVTILPKQTARVYTASGGTLTRKTDTANASGFAGWDNPNKDGAGMVMRGGVPSVVDGAGHVYQGTNVASDYTIEMCYTWRDGAHETTPSGIASVVVASRRSVTVSLPQRAGLQKRLYMRQGTSGDWVRETVGHDATAHTVTWVSPIVPRHPLPTVNSFPNADPATLKSTNDKFVVHGDGSGKWGPLEFHADGTMTSSAVPDWVPVTSFLNGAGPQTEYGYAPAYRVWPDGKVEWRGILEISPGVTAATPCITIPTVARPIEFVPMGGACNASGGKWTRIDVNDPMAKNVIRISPISGDVEWASLDSVVYYLT